MYKNCVASVTLLKCLSVVLPAILTLGWAGVGYIDTRGIGI